MRVDGADAAPGRLGVVIVGLRLEERVHALDRFRAQRREEARHVLLVPAWSRVDGVGVSRRAKGRRTALLLLASQDLGRTWIDLSRGIGGKQVVSLACGRDRAGMVIHALLDDKNTLLTTRDWAKTWIKNMLGGDPSRSAPTIDMASNQTQVVYANRSGELWRSIDFGKTWQRSN